MYFGTPAQEAIIAYNKCKNQKEKNKIYNEGIKYPFEKLAENVLNTFKFTYFDVPKSDIKTSTHKDRAQLRNIKGLWNAQYKWERRFDEEKSFVGKTPFGVSGAFIAFEIYLKNAYQELQKDFDELTLEEIIDYLFDQGHLRPKEKSLLHETRIARNSWVHDAKYPNEKIIDNIIDFLNSRNQAWPLS